MVTGEHRHGYRLRHDELGPHGFFPASVLTGVLQEAAVDGSAASGFPFAYYLRERAFWVMRRITLRYERPLRYGDSLDVTTWVSKVGRTSPTREYRFDSPSRGEPIARVRAQWVYVEAASGQPKAIPDDLRAGFAPTGEAIEPLLDVPPQDGPPASGAPHGGDPRQRVWSEQRTVEPSAVDAAGHLKCCGYVSWLEDLLLRANAADGVMPAGTSLASFDLQILSSARCGETVQLRAHAAPVWQVELLGTDGRAVAHAALWPRRCNAPRTAFVATDPTEPANALERGA